MSSRRAGLNVPLFSLRSRRSWGIGELTDLVVFADWLYRCRIDRLLLLPLGTMQPGETSPYSATSTLSIDPIYIGLEDQEDFTRAGGLAALSADGREAFDSARRSPAVAYEEVRRAKGEALSLAFAQFERQEWEPSVGRAADLAAYLERERWWLDDYALYQAIARMQGTPHWLDWPAPLRDRDVAALAEARRKLARGVLEQQYYQWVAETQWRTARAGARARGVRLLGDLPFVSGFDSPEIWARPGDYRLDVSAGVPPDAFSPTGQDWGLPTYRWDVIREGGYTWLRHRASRMALLFDGLRVDHTIGLYRTYGRPRDGEPSFTPPDEPTQIAQGEQVMRILMESGLELVAEDLGSVPDFLGASLARIGVPGCKVLRWERRWKEPSAPFIDPESFEPLSAAMTGTHDTEPLPVWWEQSLPEDRVAALDLPFFAERHVSPADRRWDDRLRDLFLELAYRSGSRDLFLPVQDVFGWPDRINTPGTVAAHNWSWTLPWPVEAAMESPEAIERAEFLNGLARATRRGRDVD